MMDRLLDLWADLREKVAMHLSGRRILQIAVILLLIFVMYLPVGMVMVHKISDDLDYATDIHVEHADMSRAVAVATALIDREVSEHRWVANDPFFMPGAWLDNMSNYQQGIIASLARFSFELVDQIGRTRGSSNADTDLQEASGLLQYAGDKWRWDLSTSFWPISTSEEQYEKAAKALRSYNNRLAKGDAIFERRADNLLATLDRIALDLGASSAALDRQIKDGIGCTFDTRADDLFYNIKGQAYAYSLILTALQDDFSSVIMGKELETAWTQMQDSFHSLVRLSPLVVSNCDADSLFLTNHLAAEGFYLLRARTQLRELTNILLK
ncbi:MAG: hypothetical protein CMF31_02455 [Kordiimonas sp.]|nr:hypothetical protein [Kordiimonas sp.]